MILTKTYPSTGSFNNIFDELFTGAPYYVRKERNNVNNAPAVNIFEDKDGYHLELNVPGRAKEDFGINVENKLLTISYTKKEETEKSELKAVRKEFSFGSFQRTFSLDDKIDAEGINARYENGLLKLYIPKKEETKATPKQIQVQ